MATDAYPPGQLLVGPHIADTWDPQAMTAVLDLLTPENCRVLIGTKEPLEGRPFWSQKETYYGTEYDIRPLDLDSFNAPIAKVELALPEVNPFVSKNLRLLSDTPAATVRVHCRWHVTAGVLTPLLPAASHPTDPDSRYILRPIILQARRHLARPPWHCQILPSLVSLSWNYPRAPFRRSCADDCPGEKSDRWPTRLRVPPC